MVCSTDEQLVQFHWTMEENLEWDNVIWESQRSALGLVKHAPEESKSNCKGENDANLERKWNYKS